MRNSERNYTMCRQVFLTPIICIFASLTQGETQKLRSACEIVTAVSLIRIPNLEIKEVSVKDILQFIYSKYRDIEIDPPEGRVLIFEFDFQLPKSILEQKISFEAKNVTMIQAINLVFSDIPIALRFEPGKLIFCEL